MTAGEATAAAEPHGRNAIWLTAGTLMIGASGFVFLALIGHGRLTPASSAALSSTYLLSNILGPGIFVAVEQETSRVISGSLAHGRWPHQSVRRLARSAAILGGATVLLLLAITPVLLGPVLNGEIGLALALAVAVLGSAWVYFVRGMTGGERRFARYATTWVVDGAVRLLGCGTLAVFDVREPVPYGLALALGPLLAAAVVPVGVRDRPEDSSPPLSWRTIWHAVGWLLVASALTMVLANLSPVVVTAEHPEAKAIAFGFATAVVLTRIPLLAMGSVQALVLPRLSASTTLGRLDLVRSDMRRGLIVIGAIGALSIAVVAVIGRWGIRLAYGAATDTTSTPVLTLLALSAIVLMAVQLLQPALIALHRHRDLVLGWAIGAVLFGGILLLPVDSIAKAVTAQLVGPFSTLAYHLVVLWRATRVSFVPG